MAKRKMKNPYKKGSLLWKLYRGTPAKELEIRKRNYEKMKSGEWLLAFLRSGKMGRWRWKFDEKKGGFISVRKLKPSVRNLKKV